MQRTARVFSPGLSSPLHLELGISACKEIAQKQKQHKNQLSIIFPLTLRNRVNNRTRILERERKNISLGRDQCVIAAFYRTHLSGKKAKVNHREKDDVSQIQTNSVYGSIPHAMQTGKRSLGVTADKALFGRSIEPPANNT